MLPAPVVRAGGAAQVYAMAKGAPLYGNVMTVKVQNPVTVSAHGLPQVVLENLATYKPQLELMRYVSRRTATSTFSRGMRNAGYVHPSHAPLPSGTGSHTHGGAHAGIGSSVAAIRPTEWPVTNYGQVIDATQGLTGFLQLHDVYFRDPTGVVAATPLPCPSGRVAQQLPGRTFAYSRPFKPGYFRFRWSIIDPTDPRGQRISGPLSDTVSLTTNVYPFTPHLPIDGLATASVNPNCIPDELRVWLGSTSRLPR